VSDSLFTFRVFVDYEETWPVKGDAGEAVLESVKELNPDAEYICVERVEEPRLKFNWIRS
jgi:hypothetical protein